MFRLFARSRFPRPVITREILRLKWSRTMLLGTGASALAYYMSNTSTIHADAPSEKDFIFKKSGPSTGLYLTSRAVAEVPKEESGILRIESISIPSNPGSEDFVSVLLTDDMTYCGIFDGHNGSTTSNIIAGLLPSTVFRALEELPFTSTIVDQQKDYHSELGSPPVPTRPTDEEIDAAIKKAFLSVDDILVNQALQYALSRNLDAHAANALASAQAGSCALVSIYEHETRQLRVALTGDSRAVLGRRVSKDSEKPMYEVHVLSKDQNGHNAAEVARMSAEHPGEVIAEKGRILGWGMSRAFGDASMKWSLEDQERVKNEYFGDRPYPNVKTPPYFTAEPEITTTQIQKGDFLILASDGLWECLTNEEAVGLVGLWLGEHKVDRIQKERELLDEFSWLFELDGNPIERDELPVVLKEDNTIRHKQWRATKRFLNVDENSAAHLVRNALGGANHDLIGALLTLAPPRARRYRDDISASVVFFE